MRAFTDVEKQQLQAKIRDRAVVTRFKTSNLSKWTSNLSKYGLLVAILCMLVCDVLRLMRRNFGYDQYTGIVLMLMLLFNHIASHFTKTGWPNRVMKTITWICYIFGSAYVVWVLFVA
jgi:hypothetical protein